MYSLILRNEREETITDCYGYDTLRQARLAAKYRLSDAWARDAETTHEALGTVEALIYDESGDCVEHLFRKVTV